MADLEDGVEEDNTLAYNLAAHVHFLGSPARTSGQYADSIKQTNQLTVPADVTASGFYLTNGWNRILGNAASGGWGGFALPSLQAPVGSHRNVQLTPASRPLLQFDGNSAHSSGFWWQRGGAIYFGGRLWESGSTLWYNSGRNPVPRDTCEPPGGTTTQSHACAKANQAFTVLRNTKVFTTYY